MEHTLTTLSEGNASPLNPIFWRHQIDGSLEGRSLGINLIFWLRQNNQDQWILTIYGNGTETYRTFSQKQTAFEWIQNISARSTSEEEFLFHFDML
ncbi:MAG: hypothetical protein JW860_12880 [Sedimentisphaerales bacterium]|nr:hypothetical protein [Sedimentisphaerales bacterium]